MTITSHFKDPAVLDGVLDGGLVRRSAWSRARRAFRQEAKEFCLFTGLHGYKYIVQPGKHRAERLFWVLVVTVSLVAAVLLMLIAYDFNRSHPTILAVDTTHYPLWAVDAPGVTVCPSNKVWRSKALQLIRTLVLPADVSEEEMLDDLGLLVELITPRAHNTTKFARLQDILDKNSVSVDHAVRYVTPSCDELLIRCAWKRRQCLHCSDIFRQVPTAYGYCCSFNYLDRDIHRHKPRMGGCVGVSYNEVQRLSACGYTNGLSVTVRINPKEVMSSILASHAAMVLIHDPMQYPDGNADLKVVGAGTVSFISYSGEVTQTSQRLRALPGDVRKCHFESEMYLPMFRAYTFENCMASCQANRTLEKCGCAPLTFPHVLRRKLCTLMDVPCVASILSLSAFNATTCPLCRPLCDNVEYQVETSVGNLQVDTMPEGDGLTDDITGIEENYALFHVFANDLVTTRYKMDAYMTREDLLGSLGGLSGLLVGFSLVSGFEFVYFFTIRPFFRMRARLAASREESRAASAAAAQLAQHDTEAGKESSSGRSASSSASGQSSAKPFPLVAPHVFRLRRRGAELDKEDRRSNRKKGRNMIPVIE